MVFTFMSQESTTLQVDVCTLVSLTRRHTIRRNLVRLDMNGSPTSGPPPSGSRELRCSVTSGLDILATSTTLTAASPPTPRKSSPSSSSQTTERRIKFSGSSMEKKVRFIIAPNNKTDLELKSFLAFHSTRRVNK